MNIQLSSCHLFAFRRCLAVSNQIVNSTQEEAPVDSENPDCLKESLNPGLLWTIPLNTLKSCSPTSYQVIYYHSYSLILDIFLISHTICTLFLFQIWKISNSTVTNFFLVNTYMLLTFYWIYFNIKLSIFLSINWSIIFLEPLQCNDSKENNTNLFPKYSCMHIITIYSCFALNQTVLEIHRF